MEHDSVHLSPQVLDWAASQIGSTLEEFANRISKRRASRIVDGMLTSSDAIKFAKATGVPLGYLFLGRPPPPRTLPVADFRTLPEAHPLGRDFFNVFDDIEYKQSWYREYLSAAGAERLPFVGKFKGRTPSAKAVAVDMRQVLAMTESSTALLRTADDHFAMLASKCEGVGVLVFKNSVVGNNTKRPLSVKEFRGFAVADSLAPVIFVNGADAPAAWVFTLAHELAHLWMGDSGVSDVDPSASNADERFCNAVAAEFLVPAARFKEVWASSEGLEASAKIDHARRYFRVSTLVVARRALELALISASAYTAIYKQAVHHAKKRGEGGGSFYRTLAIRNSKKLSQRVASLAVSGSLSLREAGRLLNTNPNNVVKFYAKQNPLSV
jgi:Zn-dependent peptidase ImmA (M78 family)